MGEVKSSSGKNTKGIERKTKQKWLAEALLDLLAKSKEVKII